MEKISVVINTRNAALHLARVLDAVAGFDEVLVCDMESTDGTVELARSRGCRVVTFPRGECNIVEPARQFAIEQAEGPWLLFVDADELVPPALRDYLYDRVGRADCPAGIAIPRKNYFMGRFMHSTYPDHVLRFFRKDKAEWPPVIHTAPRVDGRVERIPGSRADLAFEHLANDSVADILRKHNIYSNNEKPRRLGRGYGWGALIGRPAFRFFKSYVLKRGFMDGVPGLVYAILTAIYQFEVMAKVLEHEGAHKGA